MSSGDKSPRSVADNVRYLIEAYAGSYDQMKQPEGASVAYDLRKNILPALLNLVTPLPSIAAPAEEVIQALRELADGYFRDPLGNKFELSIAGRTSREAIVAQALAQRSAIEPKRHALEGKLLNVLRLSDELCTAVDNEADDIGGSRPSLTILQELGPAVGDANEAVEEAKAEIEATTDDRVARTEVEHAGGWIPVEWRRNTDPYVSDDTHIRQMRSPFYEGVKFCVRRHGNVLNKTGEWELEPMPSSRDDAFYERCRFDSFEAAVAVLDGPSNTPEKR